MRCRFLIVAGCFLIGPACAGDEKKPCLDPFDESIEIGALVSADTIGAFCSPSDFDASSIEGSFWGFGFVRIEPCGDNGLHVRGATSLATDPTYEARRIAEGLFLRVRLEGSATELLLCGVGEEDGAFAGVRRFCNNSGAEPQCGPATAAQLRPITPMDDEPVSSGLELVAEVNTSSNGSGGRAEWDTTFVANVEVDDGRVYLATREEGLRIFDVRDPAHPVERGFLAFDDLNDIKPFNVGGRRYVVLANGETTPIVDVTDGDNPRVIAEVGTSSHRIDLEVTAAGRVLLYVGDLPSEVPIFDLTVPSVPTLVGKVPIPEPASSVHAPIVKDGRLYAAAGFGGFHVIDPWPDPGAATYHGSIFETRFHSHHAGIFEVDGITYALHGDEVGSERWLKIFNVTPGSPGFLEEVSYYVARYFISTHNITMVGTRAYVAYYQDGLRVLDLSDPRNPRLAAHYNTWRPESAPHAFFEGAIDVDVDEETGLIYLAESPRGLMIFRETAD